MLHTCKENRPIQSLTFGLLTALLCVLLTLPITAQEGDSPADSLPAKSQVVQAEIPVGTGQGKVPNHALGVVDPGTMEAIEARWEKLRKTLNRSHRDDPLPGAVSVKDVRPWTPPADTASRALGADPFVVQVNGTPSSVAPGGFTSTVNEPSVASVDDYVFYTANWYAAASTDGGTSWTFVNPFTGPFAEPAGEDFCCDQQAIYEPNSNTMFWLQQMIPDTSTDNGTQRINVDQGSDGTWDCFYDVTGQQAGLPDESFPDFPDFALSDQHLFVTSNQFASGVGGFQGAFVARLALADITTCSNTTTDFYTDTSGFGSFRLTQGAGDTMYFADQETASSLRVWTWPQGDASPTSVLRSITPFLFGTRVCPGPDGVNWCSFHDSRILGAAKAGDRIGFFWVAQQNPGGGFPFPYTQGTILDTTNNLAVVEEPLIWSNDAAWVYPSIAGNSNGDFGGTIMWGGGTFFPQCSAFLVDDANGDSFSPFEHQVVISGTTSGGTRSGDYLTSHTHHPNDSVYSSSCFSYLAGNAGTSRFVLFGRESNFNTTDIFADGFESGNVTAWSSSAGD